MVDREKQEMSKWAAALLQGVGGAALAIGVLGVLRPGTDRWLGAALIAISVVFGLATVASGSPRTLRALAVALSALWIGALACVVVIIHDASSVPRDYTSGYDNTDPGKCAEGAHVATLIPGTETTILDENRQPIGVLQLARSTLCATIWPHVTLTAQAAHALKGRTLELAVARPADNARAPYPLPLKGGREGYGNQLGATACIEGQARLLASPAHPAGPLAHTRCH